MSQAWKGGRYVKPTVRFISSNGSQWLVRATVCADTNRRTETAKRVKRRACTLTLISALYGSTDSARPRAVMVSWITTSASSSLAGIVPLLMAFRSQDTASVSNSQKVVTASVPSMRSVRLRVENVSPSSLLCKLTIMLSLEIVTFVACRADTHPSEKGWDARSFSSRLSSPPGVNGRG